MGSAPGHPILKRVLDNIQSYFAQGKHLSSKSIIKSTGPGIWSDAITQTLNESYGVIFGRNESHAGDHKPEAYPFSHRDMHRKGAHIGDVILFPTRAFAIGSGGAGLDGHSSSDQLIRHNFRGTWKG